MTLGNINSFTNKTMKWMWQKPSEASVPPVMGEFWQDNQYPVLRENAHRASEPSLTSRKAISLTLSHSSSWKSWKDKCLPFSISAEETKEERGEAPGSRSPGFTKGELGFVLPSRPNLRDCWGTRGHLRWTHSCSECLQVECLERRPHQSHHSDYQSNLRAGRGIWN